MTKSMNWSAASRWQQLMAEWDAVSAQYELARSRADDPAIDDAQRAALRSAVERTLTRLRELKASIDELVSTGAAERPEPDGQFTAATIDFDRDMDEVGARAKRLMS